MKNLKLLCFLGLALTMFVGCEEDPIEYPGEKSNSELYGVGLSSVLNPGSFLSTYIGDMRAAGDALLTDKIANAKSFATEHSALALHHFVPSGNITTGSLTTSDQAVSGSSATGSVLVYYFTKGGTELAYQVSATSEGFLHEGFSGSGGSYTKVVEATEIVADLSSGTITDMASGTSTSWQYTESTYTLTRVSGSGGQASVLIMDLTSNNGTLDYSVNGDLRVDSDWAGGGIEGAAIIYDENGDIDIEGDWPLIPVPAGFEDYRILLFSQEGYYETTQTLSDNLGDCVRANCAGDDGWIANAYSNYGDFVPVLAGILYIPEDANVEVSPSGLKRIYSYTALSGESVVYTITASPTVFGHSVEVDGVQKYVAEETRDDDDRTTFLDEVGSGDLLQEMLLKAVGSSVDGIGRGGLNNGFFWCMSVTVNADNSGKVNLTWDNNADLGVDWTTHQRLPWREAVFSAGATSGTWQNIQNDPYPILYTW
ncbi:MAG: hypothetical protein JXQ96_23205 [Cyclobacteriaceae bacterium]